MVNLSLTSPEPSKDIGSFEGSDFKKAVIVHDFIITGIEVPAELKTSEDFALVREKSKRIGKILRKADIDEVKSQKELELRA